ncbi:MAG: FtsQ-type POTRA domain-containing protein, partial [Actinomycetota bacterium]
MGISAGAFFWLSQSEIFAIEEIELEGNRITGTAEIMERAVPLLKGQSLLKPSYSEAEEAVAALPYIDGVEVERDFPDSVRILVR